MEKDNDYPPKSGILTQYAHLKGMAECLPIIRELVGLPKHGRINTENFIGRAVQRFIDNDSKSVVRESGTDKH